MVGEAPDTDLPDTEVALYDVARGEWKMVGASSAGCFGKANRGLTVGLMSRRGRGEGVARGDGGSSHDDEEPCCLEADGVDDGRFLTIGMGSFVEESLDDG